MSLSPEFSSAEPETPPGWEFMSAATITQFRSYQMQRLTDELALPPAVPTDTDSLSDAEKQAYYKARHQNYLTGRAYVEEYVDKIEDPGLVSELAMLLYEYSIYNMSNNTWQLGKLGSKAEPTAQYSGRQRFAQEVARIAAREADAG